LAEPVDALLGVLGREEDGRERTARGKVLERNKRHGDLADSPCGVRRLQHEGALHSLSQRFARLIGENNQQMRPGAAFSSIRLLALSTSLPAIALVKTVQDVTMAGRR
jgi:hypothetical protein